jgi:outer membrane lipoprotein-sorting protein
MLTQQFDLAKLAADRRWSFVFPAPLGQIVYLEKSGLRYLVQFERRQYTEVSANAFGFELSRVLMPNSIADRLRSHQYEKLGLEPVNGRTAVKYRLTANDASTHMILVDQETGLPLRSELSVVAPSGKKSRVIVEARDVQLNPDRIQFDVPVGMKKVGPQEARQYIEAFASALRPFSDIISGTQSTGGALNR